MSCQRLVLRLAPLSFHPLLFSTQVSHHSAPPAPPSSWYRMSVFLSRLLPRPPSSRAKSPSRLQRPTRRDGGASGARKIGPQQDTDTTTTTTSIQPVTARNLVDLAASPPNYSLLDKTTRTESALVLALVRFQRRFIAKAPSSSPQFVHLPNIASACGAITSDLPSFLSPLLKHKAGLH